MYLEYLEGAYLNQRIPISVKQTKGDDTTSLGESMAVEFPGFDSSSRHLKGEFLELKLSNELPDGADVTRTVEFDLTDALANSANVLATG